MPTSSIIDALDAAVRTDLLNWRDTWFHLLLWSTAAVALGLALEGPELWYEIKHIWLDRRDRRMFLALTSHEVPPRWKSFAFTGWILIVLGVAGEGVFDAMVSRADGQLQTFNDILLQDAQREAASAKESAGEAYERAAKTEKEAAEDLKATNVARQKAEEARQKAEGFQLQIAQANERAANAEKGAAEANLKYEEERKARLLIEQKMADRHITPEQQAKILAVLKKMKPRDIIVQSLLSEGREAFQYAGELADVFKKAGWNVTDPTGLGSYSVPLVGVIAIASEDAETRQELDVVANALIAGEVCTVPVRVSPAKAGKPARDIEVWVGSK